MTNNENLSHVRRLAALAVLINIAVVIASAIALPRALLVLVPIVGLTLPLLTTAVLEALLQRQLSDGESSDAHRPILGPRCATS
jgi:hypothetical protein